MWTLEWAYTSKNNNMMAFVVDEEHFRKRLLLTDVDILDTLS
jgi:hypothetical protein